MFHGPYLFSPLMLQYQSVRHLLISSKGLNTLHIFCPDLELIPVSERQNPSAYFVQSELTDLTENHVVYNTCIRFFDAHRLKIFF